MNMKKLLITLFMMCAVPVCAQRVDKPGEPYDYFVTVMVYQTMTNKLRIDIEWSDGKISGFLRDSEGNKIEIKTVPEALVYMSKRGWSYVSEFPNGGVINFVFKKSVTSDEEAKQFFYFEEDFKKKK